jgi:hypothetical protein
MSLSARLRRLEIEAAALQGESNLLRGSLCHQVGGIGRRLEAVQRMLVLIRLTWRVLSCRRRGK